MFVGLLAARNIDLRTHRARPFVRALAVPHDLILVMEPNHARYLQSMAPELAGRVQLLGRWTTGPIADPIGQPRAAFEHCLQVLERAVESWLDKLTRRRSGPPTSGV
jgi:protein-tyrosine phosphatase